MTTIEISPSLVDVSVEGQTIEVTVAPGAPSTAAQVAFDDTSTTNKGTNVQAIIEQLDAHGGSGGGSGSSLAFKTVGLTTGDYKVSDYASGQAAIQAASDALAALGGGLIWLLDQIECDDATIDCGGGLQYAAVKLGDYVSINCEAGLAWEDGASATFTHQGANVNFLLCPGGFSRIDGKMWGRGNYTCPINGVNTITAAGTNTLGGGLLLTRRRVNIGTLHIEGFAERGFHPNNTDSPAVNALGFQADQIRIKACGGYGFMLHAWASDCEINQLWVGSCANNVELLNGECRIGILHSWGSAGNGLNFDANATGCAIGEAYIETNAGWGVIYNGSHRNHIGSLELWANGLGGNGGGIRRIDSTKNTIGVCTARNNIGALVHSTGASFDNSIPVLIQRDEYAALDNNTPITHAATVAQGDTAVSFTDSPLDTSSPSKHLHCWLVIPGAGTAGATLTSARITAVADANHCTIDTPVPTGVTGAAAVIHATHDGIWEATNPSTLDAAATPNYYGGSLPLAQVLSTQAFINPTSTVDMVGVNPRGAIVLTGQSGNLNLNRSLGDTYDLTLTGNITISFLARPSPLLRGLEMVVYLRQDGTGSRLLTAVGSNVKLAYGALTLSTSANAVDVVRFRCDGTNWYEVGRRIQDAASVRGDLGLGNAATKNVGTSAGTVAAGDDSRFTDSRTPTAHHATHETGGSDPIAHLAASVIDSGTMAAARLPSLDGITAPAADVAFNGHKATGLADPTSAQDAATRAYVLAQIALLVNSAPGLLDTLAEIDAAIGNDPNFATTITTALAGKQASDSDLTDFAALTPSTNDVLQFISGHWANRTTAQLKATLSLVKGDVGLGNVDNTADTSKPVSTAQQAALDLKAPLASPTFTGTTTAPEFTASGLTGAVAGARWVGATTSGAPTTGTFAVGDFVVDQSGAMWICTVAGTPGTWVNPTTSISGVALQLSLTETVLYPPVTTTLGNTSFLVQQNETWGFLPRVSTITADGTNFTVTFASSILGTNGRVGDTFSCWLTGFTPSGWNVGSSASPLTATITDSTHVTIPNAATPASITVWGICNVLPEQYGPSQGGGPPAIFQITGTNKYRRSVDPTYGIGPVLQLEMLTTNDTAPSFTCNVTNGSHTITIAGDKRSSILPGMRIVIATGSPPAQDTSKLNADAVVSTVTYDGTNTSIDMAIEQTFSFANWLGSTGTATLTFVPNITLPEQIVVSSEAFGSTTVVSFPLNSSTFGKPGEGQGWGIGAWLGNLYGTLAGGSLKNINEIGLYVSPFIGSGASALQRIGALIDDVHSARATAQHLGSTTKNIGLAIGGMSADSASYYPYVGASASNGNVGLLNAASTVHPPAPAVCFAASAQTLNQSGATVTVDSTAGFPSTGTFLANVSHVGHFTQTVTYTGKTSTTFTGCTVASGTFSLVTACAIISPNAYQDVSAGAFTVQAFGTTAALSSTASVSATTAASVISTGTPLYAGQILEIINVSAAGINLTFSSGATPGLRLGRGGTRVLGSGGTLRLKWSSALSLWCEEGYSAGDYGNVAPGTPSVDMGRAYTPSSTTEGSLLAAGAATTGLFAAGVTVGDMWEIDLSGTLLNNSGTNTYTSRIRVYFGAFAIGDVTSAALTSSATTREWSWKLRVFVETIGGANTGTLRVSGQRIGFANVLGIGTGYRTFAANTMETDVAETTGTSASLITNAASDFNVTAAHSNATASMTTTLTECVVRYYPKHS